MAKTLEKQVSIYDTNKEELRITIPPPKVNHPPSKYRPSFCQDLVHHMSRGKSFYSFAAIVRVSTSALDHWLKRHPEFKEAKEMGEAESLNYWEDQGLNGMHEGKTFNSHVWIHGMRCRFRNLGWREKFPEDEAPGGTVINNTVQLTPAQLADLIRVAKGETIAKTVEIANDQQTLDSDAITES